MFCSDAGRRHQFMLRIEVTLEVLLSFHSYYYSYRPPVPLSALQAVEPSQYRVLGNLSFTWGRAFFTLWHESVNSILFTLLHQKCKNAWPNPTKVKLSQDSHLARILRSIGQNRQIAGQEDDRNSNRSERRENLQRYFRPPRRTEGYRGEGEAEAMVWICQW